MVKYEIEALYIYVDLCVVDICLYVIMDLLLLFYTTSTVMNVVNLDAVVLFLQKNK